MFNRSILQKEASPWQPQALRSCNAADWGRRPLSSVGCSVGPGGPRTPWQQRLFKSYSTWTKANSSAQAPPVPAASSCQPAWSPAAQTAELFVRRGDAEPHLASQLRGFAPSHLEELLGTDRAAAEHRQVQPALANYSNIDARRGRINAGNQTRIRTDPMETHKHVWRRRSWNTTHELINDRVRSIKYTRGHERHLA